MGKESSSKTFIDDEGYRRFCDSNRLVHRWVVKNSGQPLNFYHHVHHIDGNKLNNDISNLQVVTPEEHERIHEREFNFSNTSDNKYVQFSEMSNLHIHSSNMEFFSKKIMGIILILMGGIIIIFAGLTTSMGGGNTCFITLFIVGIFIIIGFKLLER